MRVLVVIPHHGQLSPQGAAKRVGEILLHLPTSGPDSTLQILIPEAARALKLPDWPDKRHYFYEPRILGRSIPFCLDHCRSLQTAYLRIVKEERIDVVLFSFPWGLASLATRSPVPTIYLSHGVESDFAITTLQHLGMNVPIVRAMFQAWIASIEKVACEKAKFILTMSEDDRRRYSSKYGIPSEKTAFLPHPAVVSPRYENGKEMRKKYSIPENAFLVVFHGTWNHYPNREAISAITSDIAPYCRQQHPSMYFLVAGPGVPQSRQEGVVEVGYEEHLSTLIQACDAAIVPIRSGGGVRMKLFDYFVNGTPVVSTAFGAQGLGLRNGQEAMLTENSPRALAEALLELARNPDLRASLAHHAAAFIQEHHSPNRVRMVLAKAFETATARRFQDTGT